MNVTEECHEIINSLDVTALCDSLANAIYCGDWALANALHSRIRTLIAEGQYPD